MSAAAAATARATGAERIRVVTAASLFDGHDAAIHIMRRLLQAQGAEVIHLGHDRSVEEIAEAPVQEDAHAVAVSSYQGGHLEFFADLVDYSIVDAASADALPRRRSATIGGHRRRVARRAEVPMELPGIRGRVAIVTGAGGGIGAAYARGLAAAGAKVAVAEIDKEAGARVAQEICAAGGSAEAVEVDVGSPESTRVMAERVVAAFGGIDFLVNNAAIFANMNLSGYLDVDWSYYTRFLNVNLNGALLCTRACVPAMRRRGGGAIVNQSSTAAWMATGPYSLAKLALNGLTQGLARELGPQKIRVNAIAPGPTDTGALHSVVPDSFLDPMVAGLPLARIGKPEDHVGTLLFLLSDAAAWITGQVVNVDGGQAMRP